MVARAVTPATGAAAQTRTATVRARAGVVLAATPGAAAARRARTASSVVLAVGDRRRTAALRGVEVKRTVVRGCIVARVKCVAEVSLTRRGESACLAMVARARQRDLPLFPRSASFASRGPRSVRLSARVRVGQRAWAGFRLRPHFVRLAYSRQRLPSALAPHLHTCKGCVHRPEPYVEADAADCLRLAAVRTAVARLRAFRAAMIAPRLAVLCAAVRRAWAASIAA